MIVNTSHMDTFLFWIFVFTRKICVKSGTDMKVDIKDSALYISTLC